MTKVGDLEVARTGLCTTQAEDGGYDFRTELIESTTRAGYYPGAAPIARQADQRARVRAAARRPGRRRAGQRQADRRVRHRDLGGDDRRGAGRLRPLLRAAVLADLRPGGRRRAGGQPRRAGLSRRAATETEVRRADWYGEDLSGQEHTRVAFVGVDLTEATDDGAVFTECTFRDCRFNLSAAHRRRLPELHLHRLLVLPGDLHRLQVRRAARSSAAPST